MDNCYLRKATKDDLEILFEWANEKEVRKNSISTDEISFEEHQEWFNNKLNSENCDIYILCKDEIPIGQIRLDYNGNHAVVSYSICSKYRGQGYGQFMLVLAEEKVRQTHKEISIFDAEVKTENIALRKKFEELGYKSVELIKYEKNKIDNPAIMGDISKKYAKEVKRVLLLSNNENVTELYEWLCCNDINVFFYSGRLLYDQVENMKPDIIISYNYNYIIKKEIIDLMRGNIINLHISLLPYNKGASPNFWSFIDDTPKGVTIHYVDEGIDTGDIIAQKELFFDETCETFESTYNKLNSSIKELLYEKWKDIIDKKIVPIAQNENGSCHNIRDLNELRKRVKFNWNDNISFVKGKIKEVI